MQNRRLWTNAVIAHLQSNLELIRQEFLMGWDVEELERTKTSLTALRDQIDEAIKRKPIGSKTKQALLDLKMTVGYLDPNSSAAKAMRNSIEAFEICEWEASEASSLVKRLQAINAELLAACEDVLSAFTPTDIEEQNIIDNLKAAIEKGKQ